MSEEPKQVTHPAPDNTAAELAIAASQFPELSTMTAAGAIGWLAVELSALRAAPPAWVPVAEQLPGAGKTVLAAYLNRLGKPRRIRAVYVAEKTREADNECDSCYDEATDTYYWPAGWYEQIDNWDDYSHVAVTEGTITHWHEMPAIDAAIAKGEAL